MSHQLSEGASGSDSNNTTSSTWIGYLASSITVLFALIVLTGRIYAESYWHVFGLSPALAGMSVIDYAVMSPDTAIASALLALCAVLLFLSFRGEPRFVTTDNWRIVLGIGIGISAVGIVGSLSITNVVHRPMLFPGFRGFLLGAGQILWVAGTDLYMSCVSVLPEKTLYVLDKLYSVSGRSLELVSLLHWGLSAITVAFLLLLTLSMASSFGHDDAVFMYKTAHPAMIQVDSTKGLGTVVTPENTDNTTFVEAKVITEAGGFLYVTTNLTMPSDRHQQLIIRAIPVSSIQSMSYGVSHP